MTFPRFAFPRIFRFALLASAALVPVGCGGDEGVRKSIVSKTTDSGNKPGPTEAAGDYRLLGLMVPADNPIWFFKYNGPAAEITKYEADFDKLAASVQFNGNALPAFTPPEGWERGPGRGGIIAATVKTTDGKQEVGISQLPPSPDAVKSNLTRWIGQIGLQPGADDEAKFTKVIDSKGGKVLRVDLRGPKNPTTGRGGMGMGMPPGHP